MRDERLDILRGFAMIGVLANHLTFPMKQFYEMPGWEIPSPTKYGYSSASSLFVMLSGYMIGLVYFNRPFALETIARRALKIYIINIIVLLSTIPVAIFFNQREMIEWRYASLAHDAPAAVIEFLTLRSAPQYLDVLNLYVGLLLLAPAAILIARRSQTLLVAISVGVWCLKQVADARNGAADGIGSGQSVFDPVAWQMVFFLPMIAGHHKLHLRGFAYFAQRPIMVCAIVLAWAGVAIARHLHTEILFPHADVLLGSANHGLFRTIHAMLTMTMFVALLALARPLIGLAPFRVLASLGRNSLLVFASSIPITYVLVAISMRSPDPHLAYLMSALVLLSATGCIAFWAEGRARRRVRDGSEPVGLIGDGPAQSSAIPVARAEALPGVMPL